MSNESGGRASPPWVRVLAAADAMQRHRIELAERMLPIIEAGRTATEGWARATAPLMAAGEHMRAIMAALTPAPEVLEKIEWLRRDEERCEAIEATGWMAHPSSPFRLIEQGELVGEDLVRAVEDYYREDWDAVAAGMNARVDACLIDDEAKATFAEALAAHGAGLFRCAPRLLFPELEREGFAYIFSSAIHPPSCAPARIDGVCPVVVSEAATKLCFTRSPRMRPPRERSKGR